MKQTFTSPFSRTVFCLIASLFVSQQIAGQCTPAQRLTDSLALVALYNAADGPGWVDNTNWLQPGQPMGTWYGVTTSAQGCVTCLDLDGTIDCSWGCCPSFTGNGLLGTLPAIIGNLKECVYLGLSGNSLSGSIPAQIGGLTKIQYLMLALNEFTGTIPSTVGGLTSLKLLDVVGNNLTGTIPNVFSGMNELFLFGFSDNQLTGSIPLSLMGLPQLHYIFLDRNQMSGTIPPNIGELPNLGHLFLYANQFTGSIPASLGNSTTLLQMYLSGNDLSGCLPGQLKNLCGKINCAIEANPQLSTQSWDNFCAFNEGMCTSETYEYPEESKITIAPNPVSDQLGIVAPCRGRYAATIEVLDMWGRLLMTTHVSDCLLNEFHKEMDVSALCPGFYTTLVRADDVTARAFFIKR